MRPQRQSCASGLREDRHPEPCLRRCSARRSTPKSRSLATTVRRRTIRHVPYGRWALSVPDGTATRVDAHAPVGSPSQGGDAQRGPACLHYVRRTRPLSQLGDCAQHPRAASNSDLFPLPARHYVQVDPPSDGSQPAQVAPAQAHRERMMRALTARAREQTRRIDQQVDSVQLPSSAVSSTTFGAPLSRLRQPVRSACTPAAPTIGSRGTGSSAR